MSFFLSLKNKLINRRKYPNFIDMPSLMLAFFAMGSFLVAGYFGFLLSEVVPEFLREANKIPISKWGWQGCFLVIILSFISIYTWFFASIFWRCNNILRERLFS